MIDKQYIVGQQYPLEELDNIAIWWQTHKEYDVNEYADHIEIALRDEKYVAADKIRDLKAELAKIKEDIEQETFGLVRDDFDEKKARAAEIVNDLRILEGKEPREVKE